MYVMFCHVVFAVLFMHYSMVPHLYQPVAEGVSNLNNTVFFDWFNVFFVSFNGCCNSFNGRFIPINGYFIAINGSAIVQVWSKFEAKSKG